MLMYHEARSSLNSGRFEARTRNTEEGNHAAVNQSVRVAFGALLALAAHAALAAPSGPPVRIGSTLALTGALAATGLVHKIVGEIYVEQLNRKNGLLGRPVEWVLKDDQSRPDLARTLYEQLITVDKVDLIMGPYATANILSAMGVAQRYNKVLIHHTFGTRASRNTTCNFRPAGSRAIRTTRYPGSSSTRSRLPRSRRSRWQSSPANSLRCTSFLWARARPQRSADFAKSLFSNGTSATATSAPSPRG